VGGSIIERRLEYVVEPLEGLICYRIPLIKAFISGLPLYALVKAK
jgi:hypothetical protein